jgi:hypothetical protein
LALTKLSFREDGVYLYDAADQIILLVQPQANEELLTELFGVTKIEEVESEGTIP